VNIVTTGVEFFKEKLELLTRWSGKLSFRLFAAAENSA